MAQGWLVLLVLPSLLCSTLPVSSVRQLKDPLQRCTLLSAPSVSHWGEACFIARWRVKGLSVWRRQRSLRGGDDSSLFDVSDAEGHLEPGESGKGPAVSESSPTEDEQAEKRSIAAGVRVLECV